MNDVRVTEPPRTAAIRLRDIDMRFDGFRALRDVRFSIPQGSLCGLVGPNGAGKTTTLRIVATDLLPTEGTAEVLGADVRHEVATIRPRIGYMPDAAGLYDELFLEEYLGFFAALYGLPKDRRARRIEKTVELAGVKGLSGRRLKGLSKGERQRILLARALVHDPDLLVLDEPADGLDPRGRVELRELLLLLHEQGKTILIASHVLADLEQICTDLVLIDRGRVVFAGSRERLFAGGLQRCRVRIEVSGDAAALREVLRSRQDALLVEDEDDGVEVETPAEPEFAVDLLADLVGRGLPIVSFSRSMDSLEQIYLRLTEEKPEEP